METEDQKSRVRFLEGERIFLTPVSMDDFNKYYRWFHDKECVYLDDEYFEPRPYEQTRKRFESIINGKWTFSIIHKEDGQHVGFISIFKEEDSYDKKAWLGIILNKVYWRKGFGTEAGKMALRWFFEDLGFRKLSSCTHSGNEGSIRLHEKLGFVQEGISRKEWFFGGEYVDKVMFSMLREDFERVVTHW